MLRSNFVDIPFTGNVLWLGSENIALVPSVEPIFFLCSTSSQPKDDLNYLLNHKHYSLVILFATFLLKYENNI
jgi:hypothetical protein